MMPTPPYDQKAGLIFNLKIGAEIALPYQTSVWISATSLCLENNSFTACIPANCYRRAFERTGVGHLWEVDSAGGSAPVDILGQRGRDLAANRRLRLLGGAPDVRREDHIPQALKLCNTV